MCGPQVASGERYTTSADTYSFGITMLEVYVGTAFVGNVDSAAPQRVARHLPEMFEALSKCANDRPKVR